jgi:hypothetical protein
LVAADVAARALAVIDQIQVWRDLVGSQDERIKLEAIRYLTDRMYGRPAQALSLQTSSDPFRVIVEHIAI